MSDSEKQQKEGNPKAPAIVWDDRQMNTSYANVCNVSSTREEVTLLFGTNQTWHTGQKQVTIRLSDRVILNPYAAKRLSQLLDRVVEEYEGRFGSLETAPEEIATEKH